MNVTTENPSAIGVGQVQPHVARAEGEPAQIKAVEQRLVLEQMPMIIWSTDADLRFTSSCGAGLKGLGLKTNEIVGQTVADFFRSTDTTIPGINASKKALAGESSAIEQQWQGNYYQAYIEPLRDDAGRIIGTVGVAHDITQRRKTELELREARSQLEETVAQRTEELEAANRVLGDDVIKLKELEKQLRASEDRFRGIAQAFPIPIAIARISDGRFIYVNQRFSQDFEGVADSPVGQTATDFFEYPSDWQRLIQLLDHDGFVRDYELRVLHSDQSTVWVSVSLQRTEFDGADAVLAGFLDVTSRKKTQESLKGKHDMLQRSLNLHDLDRRVLAYDIHDGMVQNLTAALMYLQSCQHQRDADKVSASLEKGARLVQESIEEARRLINGLRPPVLEEKGLVMGLENLVDEIEATSDLSTQLTCDVQFERAVPALEMAVYRIVQEGLNNVWKHSTSHVAKVDVKQEGDKLFVLVEDNGIGFELQSLKSKCCGLLGIRERAKLLGGRADIRSTPGQGTTIHVWLPVAESIPTVPDSWFPGK